MNTRWHEGTEETHTGVVHPRQVVVVDSGWISNVCPAYSDSLDTLVRRGRDGGGNNRGCSSPVLAFLLPFPFACFEEHVLVPEVA